MSLINTVQEIAAKYSHYNAEVGQLEMGWEQADTLIEPGSLFFEHAFRLLADQHLGIDSKTMGATFMNAYAWSVSSALIIPFCVAQRVPDATLSNVAVRYHTVTYEEDGEGYESEQVRLRFLSHAFAVLPEDQCAKHVGVTVLSNRGALREWMRLQLETHYVPVITRVNKLTGLSSRAQWNLVADSCVTAFLIGHLASGVLDETARDEGLAFVKTPGSPMAKSRTSFIRLEHARVCDIFRARGGSCRYHRLLEGHTCSTCVIRLA